MRCPRRVGDPSPIGQPIFVITVPNNDAEATVDEQFQFQTEVEPGIVDGELCRAELDRLVDGGRRPLGSVHLRASSEARSSGEAILRGHRTDHFERQVGSELLVVVISRQQPQIEVTGEARIDGSVELYERSGHCQSEGRRWRNSTASMTPVKVPGNPTNALPGQESRLWGAPLSVWSKGGLG